MTVLDDARREVLEKTRQQIDEETAYKWAARAAAAYEYFRHGGELCWLRDCEEYLHEAIEHAALADHSGAVLRAVRQWVHQYVPRDI